jgi:hypothetical protein
MQDIVIKKEFDTPICPDIPGRTLLCHVETALFVIIGIREVVYYQFFGLSDFDTVEYSVYNKLI